MFQVYPRKLNVQNNVQQKNHKVSAQFSQDRPHISGRYRNTINLTRQTMGNKKGQFCFNTLEQTFIED